MERQETLTVDSLAYGGDAVGRTADGEVVFIRGGCPGDVVRVRVLADRGTFLRAVVDEVLEPSASRVTPPCPHVEACGGCQWQHVGYDAQLRAKHDSVADALSRIGGEEASCVAPAVPAERLLGYRNKVELSLGRAAAGGGRSRLTLGYSAAGSEDHVPVEECLLLPERWRRAPKALAGAIRYLGHGDDLGIARVALRVSERTGDVEVALWTRPGPFPRHRAAKVLTEAVGATSVTRVLLRGEPKERRAASVEVLGGRGHWRERLTGFEYLVSSPSFFQVNTAMAERLVESVRESLAANGSDRVADVFAGVGTFTLPLAEDAGEVVAVESSGFAIRDLRRNLQRAGLDAGIEPGDAVIALPSAGAFDLAVADPPRSGLAPALAGVLASRRPARLVYVSCDPATLARDAKRLRAEGLRLVSAVPMDLFPQTYHVETVALFARGSCSDESGTPG